MNYVLSYNESDVVHGNEAMQPTPNFRVVYTRIFILQLVPAQVKKIVFAPILRQAYLIGLYHPLDSATNLKYKLLCFLTPNKIIL